MRKFFAAIVLALLLVAPVQAADVTFAWEYDDTSVIDGFRIFIRQDGQAYDYADPTWTGTTLGGTVNGLANDTQYAAVVRAYKGQLESKDSDEVEFMLNSAEAVVEPKTFQIKTIMIGF